MCKWRDLKLKYALYLMLYDVTITDIVSKVQNLILLINHNSQYALICLHFNLLLLDF